MFPYYLRIITPHAYTHTHMHIDYREQQKILIISFKNFIFESLYYALRCVYKKNEISLKMYSYNAYTIHSHSKLKFLLCTEECECQSSSSSCDEDEEEERNENEN